MRHDRFQSLRRSNFSPVLSLLMATVVILIGFGITKLETFIEVESAQRQGRIEDGSIPARKAILAQKRTTSSQTSESEQIFTFIIETLPLEGHEPVGMKKRFDSIPVNREQFDEHSEGDTLTVYMIDGKPYAPHLFSGDLPPIGIIYWMLAVPFLCGLFFLHFAGHTNKGK